MTSLISRLGLPDQARALIVTADDLGMCHASTEGALAALTMRAATSAGLMVPAPWAREAASRSHGLDVGVHLALTAELPRYHWGPVTFAPSLLGGNGGFPSTVGDLHDHADPDEVRTECLSQLERAVELGVVPTHLSVHGSALFAAPALFDVVAELAEQARLPLRLPNRDAAASFGYPMHELAEERGIVSPDVVRHTSAGVLADPEAFVVGLGQGVTELVTRPALDTEELRALAPDASARVSDLQALLTSERLGAALDRSDVVVLGWSALRALAGTSAGRPR